MIITSLGTETEILVNLYYTVCPKNEPQNILYLNNCTELNAVKDTQTCKYLNYCSQICVQFHRTINIFTIFTKRCRKFLFSTLLSNLLTHGAYVMRDVKLC